MRISCFALILLLGAQPTAANAQQQPVTGSWTARFLPGRTQLQLSVQFEDSRDGMGSSTYGFRVEESDLKNRTRSADPGGYTRVSFTLEREAGTFTFEGRSDDSRGSGWFRFAPSVSYVRQMAGLGFQDLAPKPLFVFAVQDLTIAKVKQLKTLVADPLSTATLVRMSNHGASADYVRDLAAAGFRGLTSSAIVRAADHGVSSEFIKSMRDEGFHLDLEQMTRAVDHGVSAELAREMRSAGYKLSIEELIDAVNHGVSTDFIDEMNALGYRLPLDELIQARNHGVDAPFIRKLNELGYKGLPLHSISRLVDHGVSASFIREVRGLGYKDLTPEELSRLRDHGVSIGFIRRMNEANRSNLSVNQLIRLRDRGDE